jgi:hypothetical protein
VLGNIKIRFLYPWQRYMPGDEIWPAAGLREELIRRGYAERVIDDGLETAMVEPQTEKAVKRRGRPRTRPYKDGKPIRTRKKVSDEH